jgi:hypothetical protein
MPFMTNKLIRMMQCVHWIQTDQISDSGDCNGSWQNEWPFSKLGFTKFSATRIKHFMICVWEFRDNELLSVHFISIPQSMTGICHS